ncbi:MAG TPA: S41 family peptidase [Candidatus Saccharimonadales bacterium]|nr:S41 family peptidase [Candidatus Saccharimonadales bacterium]
MSDIDPVAPAPAADPPPDPFDSESPASSAAPVAPVTPGTPSAPITSPRSPHRRRITPTHLSIAVVAVLAGTALFLSGYSLGRHDATTPGTPSTEQQAFVPFWDAYQAITQQYAGGTVDRKTVIEGAIKGMIDSLGDPFSQYLSSEDYKRSLQGISGQFEGIGAGITSARTGGSNAQCTPFGPTCEMVVTSTVSGAPAEKAGLKAADVITEIDGVAVAGSTLDAAVAKVRGARGTVVTLTIVRGAAAPQDIRITRDVIVQKEVVTRTLANGAVGYIQITGFSDTAAADVVSALRADVAAGQRKVILDLRGNPGGFVTAARTVASQFISSGPIFWQQDARGHVVATTAEPGGVATDPSLRLVVLIDKGSASASEIVAGALQDDRRATLIGQVSYGKGTVQEWQPLPNDTGGFRLTIAKWLTPNKRWINHIGLTPDVVVPTTPTPAPGTDPVLNKALEVLGASSAGVTEAAA